MITDCTTLRKMPKSHHERPYMTRKLEHLRCAECDEFYYNSSHQYATCPNMHGKLIPALTHGETEMILSYKVRTLLPTAKRIPGLRTGFYLYMPDGKQIGGKHRVDRYIRCGTAVDWFTEWKCSELILLGLSCLIPAIHEGCKNGYAVFEPVGV